MTIRGAAQQSALACLYCSSMRSLLQAYDIVANNANRAACESIRQSVEAGDIEEAMATCNSVHAGVLEARPKRLTKI